MRVWAGVGLTSGLSRSMAPSQVDVMLDVCCPAKSSTMSQPVTSESVKARPALVTLPVRVRARARGRGRVRVRVRVWP